MIASPEASGSPSPLLRSAQMADRTASAATQADFAVETIGLTRRFGASRALDQLDLQVGWDERVALLGANGAGKTTLLRILATLARPTAGQVVIGGLSLPDGAGVIRQHLGYVGHQTLLYDDLTVRENLQFYGRLYRVPNLSQRIDRLLERVGLSERATDRVRALSRGLQQRAALARAVLHDPTILLLDEPDTGLDVTGDDLLRPALIGEDGGSRTVILTTHSLERAFALADRVVVLYRGRLVFDRPTGEADPASVAAAIRGEAR